MAPLQPIELMAFWYVALLGKYDRSATIGGLQVAPEDGRIVRQIHPERSVHHRHEDLELQTCGGAHLLRAGRDVSIAAKARLRKFGIELIDAAGIQFKLFGNASLSMPASPKIASMTGPTMGMRYSTFPTKLVSPPGNVS